MKENWYFLISNSVPGLDAIRIECAVQHGRNTTEGTELSEVMSLDGSERLIKVTGGDAEYQASRAWAKLITAGGVCNAIWLQGNPLDDDARLTWLDNQLPEAPEE